MSTQQQSTIIEPYRGISGRSFVISFDTEFNSVASVIESPEWLETNGIGGYASGTVATIHTRRYHGLLVAATRPPLGRELTLSKFVEYVSIGNDRFAISSDRYADAIDPDGCLRIRNFRLDPFPTWTFDLNGIRLERELFMIHGRNATVVRWTIIGGDENQPFTLELLPLVAFRDHHHLKRKEVSRRFYVEYGENSVSLNTDESPTVLHLSSANMAVEETAHWYDNFDLAIERERGFDCHEDLFQPLRITLTGSRSVQIIASTECIDANRVEEYRKNEIARRARLVAKGKCKSNSERALVLAADQFIVKRGNGSTVIAGYPWFSDWGRDTMIALPGLALETGRPGVAKQIIRVFADHISEGMIPNRFPDEGDTPDYNTVDATLWYFEAIRAYVAQTGDIGILSPDIYKKLVGVIEKHVEGTRFAIRVDTDGLLTAGAAGTQLTWMDAKVGDQVITPRIGKPVEIQALWFNALMSIAGFAEQLEQKDDALKFKDMAAIARESFIGQFWNDDRKCLFDVISGDRKDDAVRPNQIFAVSLHHALLDGEQARAVVDIVERELLTPYGLRSLAPDNVDYRDDYLGSPLERDSAYHQGTVWGWLLGHFAEAYRRTHSIDENLLMLAEISEWIDKHLYQAALGTASEIFDATPPHKPRGCPAQAWTVAEYLRVLSEV